MKKRSEKIEIVTVTNTQDMLSIPETLALLSDIRSLIEAARIRVSITANVEMVLLYWHIGNRILKDILGMERADYGKQIVQTLSGKLTLEYGRGFTRTNLFNMIRCAEVFPDIEIVHALSGQLSWTHFREIIHIEEKPQRTQRKRQSSVFSECWHEKINNELVRTPYELTLSAFVSVRISSLFSRHLFSNSFINKGIWRSL